MPTYVVLVDYTEKGLSSLADSPRRADDFRKVARDIGAEVKDMYWTSGPHDGIAIFDAPDDKIAAALCLYLGRRGAVRTHTLRAYSRAEFESVIEQLPE